MTVHTSIHYITLRYTTLHYITLHTLHTHIYIDMDWCVNKDVDTETERDIDRYK